jgi:hypothetical protein
VVSPANRGTRVASTGPLGAVPDARVVRAAPRLVPMQSLRSR